MQFKVNPDPSAQQTAPSHKGLEVKGAPLEEKEVKIVMPEAKADKKPKAVLQEENTDEKSPIIKGELPLIAKKQEEELIIGERPANYRAQHGSATGDIWLSLMRFFEHITEDMWVGGDINLNLLEEIVRKQLHLVLVAHGLSVGSEIEQLINQLVVFLKKRGDLLINGQNHKIDELDASIKDIIFHAIALKILSIETNVHFMNFKADPMATRRMQLLESTGGKPTYGAWEGEIYFATEHGQLSKVKSKDEQACFFMKSAVHPEILIAEDANTILNGKLTYVSHENEFYLINNNHKGELSYQKLNKAEKAKQEAIDQLFPKESFMKLKPAKDGDYANMEKLLAPNQALPKTRALRSLFSKIEDSQEFKKVARERIFELSGHQAHADAIPIQYIEKLEELEGTLQKFKEELEKMPEVTPQTYQELLDQYDGLIVDYADLDRSHGNDHTIYYVYDAENNRYIISTNNPAHKDSTNNYRFSFDHPKLEAHLSNMFIEMQNLVFNEAFDLYEERGMVGKGKDQREFSRTEALKDALKPKEVNALAGMSKEELIKAGVPANSIDDDLLAPTFVFSNRKLAMETYKAELKRSGALGKLNQFHLQSYFLKIYTSKIFNRINGFLKSPFDFTLTKDEMKALQTKYSKSMLEIESAPSAEGFQDFIQKAYFSKEFRAKHKIQDELFVKLRAHIDELTTEEVIDSEYREKGIFKIFNMVFSNQSYNPPGKGPEKTLNKPGQGFPPFKEKAEEITERQMNAVKAVIQKLHKEKPTATFSLMFCEAGKQDRKQNIFGQWIHTINNCVVMFLNNVKSKMADVKYLYYKMMRSETWMGPEYQNKAIENSAAQARTAIGPVASPGLSSHVKLSMLGGRGAPEVKGQPQVQTTVEGEEEAITDEIGMSAFI